jgi:ABC-type amino acid transport substrate-binding protein
MSFNLRRRIRKSKTNGLRSYGFEIVKNWRDDKKNGEPNHKTIAYIQSMQEQHFAVPSNQDKLRQKIEKETLRLLKDGTITQLDAQKILNKATEFGINHVKGSLFKSSLLLPRSH